MSPGGPKAHEPEGSQIRAQVLEPCMDSPCMECGNFCGFAWGRGKWGSKALLGAIEVAQ